MSMIFVLTTGTSCFIHAQTAPAKSEVPAVAFVDVNVLPMQSEQILRNQTVVVRGDRIAEVGPTARVKAPEGAVRVDGRGKYLMPGVAEMHAHIPPPTSPAQFTESVLFLYVANGVTTVRGMLGAPNQLELRARANRGDLLSPTLYLAGPSFSGNSIESADQAAQKVREQKSEGWDLLKVHPGLTREEFDAMARTAREVGIRFAGHVPAEVGLMHALEMGQETIDHLDGYIEYLGGGNAPVDEARLVEVAEKTKAKGAWVVPTMVLWETLLGVPTLENLSGLPELKYMPAQQVTGWVDAHKKRLGSPQFNRAQVVQVAANRKRLLKALSQRGVLILLGTDSPQQFSVPGFSIHRELQAMAEAGMTPFEILRSGTRNVGDYFKDKDRFGTVEAGKRADLVLLEANPLQNLANFARRSGVMVRGRWLAEKEIRERLEKIAASRKSVTGTKLAQLKRLKDWCFSAQFGACHRFSRHT
jgi:imidazolonepropionase-like amidohydrolase